MQIEAYIEELNHIADQLKQAAEDHEQKQEGGK